MEAALSRRAAGRLFALFYVGSGLLAALSLLVPQPADASYPGTILVASLAIAAGVLSWIAPWERWRRSASLWLAPLAFALIAIGNYYSGNSPLTSPIFFVVVFVWIGVDHPRWTSLRMAPLAAIAYVLPLLALPGDVGANVGTVMIIIPICLLVGECLAWLTQRLVSARQTLTESEGGYRHLVEMSPDAVLVSSGGTIVFANGAALRLSGATKDELLSRPVSELLRGHPSGHPAQGPQETALIRSDGADVRVEVSSSPVIYEGEPATELVVRDVTERSLEAEAKFQALVEHLPAIVYTAEFGADGPWSYVSPSLEALLGYSPEDWISDPDLFFNRVHPDDRAKYLAEENRSRGSQRSFSVEYRLIARDGRVVWVRDEASVVTEEGREVLQGVLYDITRWKLAEQSLRESEQREREAVQQLKDLHEMKNTFLAAVSHELRTPLTSVLGIALTLRQQTIPPEEARDLLDRLTANARKLERLLTDLLDVDRLSRGLMGADRSPTDLAALVRRVVGGLDFLAGRSVNLELTPVRVDVDAAKVERIVENLLLNATKHTPPDTTIWVRTVHRPEGVTLLVEDDGPGVPEDLWDQIFEAFLQGPTQSSHSPGTGIGLALVARLAELHGGRAWVQDRDGGGASFRVFFPASTVPSEARREAAAGAA